MTDLSASERRLITALERIDYIVERAAADIGRARQMPAQAPQDAKVHADADARLAQMQDENHRLSDDLAALHDRQDATLATVQQRLAEANERLSDAGEHTARLAAANDGLAAANRALIDAATDWPAQGEAATRAALEAEIESLRATRAAEIAQMADILDALDRMLGTPAPQPRKAPAPDDRAAGADTVLSGEPSGDGAQPAKPQAATEPARALAVERDPAMDDPLPEDDVSLFGGVYDDDDRDDGGDDPEDAPEGGPTQERR